MSLLVVGSIAYDSIHTPAGSVENVLGGSATHFASASSFFTPTRIVGVVGEDFDRNELGYLKERDADLRGIYTEKGKTFRWEGKYHLNMNARDTLKTELNVFENFTPRIVDSFRNSRYIFLANIHPGLQLDVLEQINQPQFTALDTMNFWIEGCRPSLEKVLAKVDCVILNDSEAQDFSGEYNLIRAAHYVARTGPKIVIIKKGEHGALMYYDSAFFALPAFLLERVVDPTGAGDSFAGGFMGYLAQQDNLKPETLRLAIAYGTCMASFCCEQFGAGRLKNLRKEEIAVRFSRFRKLISLY